MKSTFLLLATLATSLHAEKPAFRDAATAESLSEQYRKESLADPMKAMPAAEGEDPTVANPIGNLLENSEVLSYNGLTTLVPKNAVVSTPEKLAGRVNNPQPDGKIVGWLEFFGKNRSWISTVEVTFAQAKGDEPVSPEVLEHLGKTGNLVVAVLQNGPISVMPPKNPVTESQDPQP